MTFKKKMLVSSAAATLLISGGHLPVSEDITNLTPEFVAKANEVGEDNWQNDSMVDWVNNHRAEQTQPDEQGIYSDVPAENNQQLTDFANWKAQNMAQNGYFGHDTPDGQTVEQQYENRYGEDSKFKYIAENIAMVPWDMTQEEFDAHAFKVWRESEDGHNENMLSSTTDTGYASYRHESDGSVTWYGVQVFATDDDKHIKILDDHIEYGEKRGEETYHNPLESYDKPYNAEDIDPEKVNTGNENVEPPVEQEPGEQEPGEQEPNEQEPPVEQEPNEPEPEPQPGQPDDKEIDKEKETPAPGETEKDKETQTPDENDKGDSTEPTTPPVDSEPDNEQKPGQVETPDQGNQPDETNKGTETPAPGENETGTPTPDENDKNDSTESTTPPVDSEPDKEQEPGQVETPDQGNQKPGETEKDEETSAPDENDKGDSTETTTPPGEQNEDTTTETEKDESEVENDTNGNDENTELDEDSMTEKEENSTKPPANSKDNSKVASEGDKSNSSTTNKTISKVVDKSKGQSNVVKKPESNGKKVLPNTGEAMDQKSLIYSITALFVGLGLFLTGRRRKENK